MPAKNSDKKNTQLPDVFLSQYRNYRLDGIVMDYDNARTYLMIECNFDIREAIKYLSALRAGGW